MASTTIDWTRFGKITRPYMKPLVLKDERTDKNDVDEKIKEERENQAQNNIKKSSDQGNIMSVAQQMQKERESEIKD